jgi:hypothetical protein
MKSPMREEPSYGLLRQNNGYLATLNESTNSAEERSLKNDNEQTNSTKVLVMPGSKDNEITITPAKKKEQSGIVSGVINLKTGPEVSPKFVEFRLDQ